MSLFRPYDSYLLAVIALVECARRLPFLPLPDLFARILGTLAFTISRTKRAEIKSNLAHALHQSSTPTQEKLVPELFTLFWQELLAWSLPDAHFVAGTTVVGVEHLQDALARGKGVILWESNSFGNRVAAQAILHAQGFGLTPIHAFRHLGGLDAGEPRDSQVFYKIIHPYFNKLERRRVADILYLPQDGSLSFTRILAERLAANAILCVAADGVRGHKHISLEFLGQTHNFATGMLSLAQLTSAPLLPIFCTPQEKGGYLLEILPPLPLSPASSRAQQTDTLTAYVRLLETRILAHPEWYRHWDLLAPNRVPSGS